MTPHTSTPEAVANAYIEGTKTRNIELLKAIFHEDAVMTGYMGPDLLNAGPEPFYAALEANEIGPDYTGVVSSVTTTDKIAHAQVDETNLLGMSFTNHFHMVQLDDGSWRISSKLFRHY